jgi:hypothetical protein
MSSVLAIGKLFNDHARLVWFMYVLLIAAVPCILYTCRYIYRDQQATVAQPNVVDSTGDKTINTNVNQGTINQNNH